jgi:hypothetical protein
MEGLTGDETFMIVEFAVLFQLEGKAPESTVGRQMNNRDMVQNTN